MPRLHPNGLMIPITQIFPHKTDKVATFCAEYKHELDRSPLKFLCSTVRVLCRLTLLLIYQLDHRVIDLDHTTHMTQEVMSDWLLRFQFHVKKITLEQFQQEPVPDAIKIE